MAIPSQKTWSKRNKRISFLPVDAFGRFSVPVSIDVLRAIRLRKQSPAEVVKIAMASYIDGFDSIQMGQVKDMTYKLDKKRFDMVRTVVERVVVEACFHALMLRHPSDKHDYNSAFKEFSDSALEISDALLASSSVIGLPEREKKGIFDEPPPPFIPMSDAEIELEGARKAARDAIKKFRRERNAALRKAARLAQNTLSKGEVSSPEGEVFDPELESWSIVER